ncbi:general transcriptional corepressor trfA-like [Lucilia sericata]|uniref:general transcriptional corepressor trfA-like n=1 Tax=Lucilia sericata TaxID=13632 RepID=UPI0018A881AA|nr:general transcriptional corepressor trfA-like [Lucilia sericata]
MSTYQDCQNLINNLSNSKMDARDDTVNAAVDTLSPSNASPPDFDFNLPCRFFKSSFARSLSLTNASSSSNGNQCKSLDYDMRSINNLNSSNKKLSCLPKRETTTTTAVAAVPPLPQRRLSQAGSFYQQNEATITNTGSSSDQKQVFAVAAADDDVDDEEKPPALPARRPLSLHNLTLTQNLSVNECQMNKEQQKLQQQTVLTQLRQQAYKQANNNSNTNSIIMPANGNTNNNNNNNLHNNNKNYNNHVSTGKQSSQKPQTHHQHFTNSNGVQIINNNSSSVNNNSNNTNFRRNNNNNIVWSHQQKNVEQDCNICTFDEDGDGEDFNSNYHDTSKTSTVSDYNNHFHNSHQMLHMIPTINIHNNQQQQQQQQHQQQQHNHQQQQQHQMSSYEMLNDNTTNVEAVILQNQVDTLQWQLKQVETSCDMYRAVMEEVVRFLERYQSQKQLQQQQQQQQQQLQQQQQQMALQKHNSSNNNKMEQIPRSKSLFQVYIAGGHEKSANGNCNLDETSTSLSSTSSSSTSYLRARSSTNLIDLKHQTTNASSCKSKDDHNFETGLIPSQSYSAFKDFTWRRSPKKSDSRLNNAKDDVEEKLNQEAYRLLRTIQNLLNTSQHQPDLTHQRHSLAPASALQMGRLSKAMSTTSVMTLPGPPLLNSTSLTIGANSAGSSTPDSSTASPTTSTANNASSNNLAPEMLFLRSANMRDSRLSLRSSTDSSVHSTSSAASSASSKVETDEEPSTPFHSPPNILTHKQNHHLAGSSTEDESGFSSISSFPDIGVPLSSTLLSSTPSSSKSRSLAKELKSLKANERDLQTNDSRNSTLKANVVGLPLNSTQDMSHRWDSPSKTYHNASNKFQRFSALTNEDSNTVLWV